MNTPDALIDPRLALTQREFDSQQAQDTPHGWMPRADDESQHDSDDEAHPPGPLMPLPPVGLSTNPLSVFLAPPTPAFMQALTQAHALSSASRSAIQGIAQSSSILEALALIMARMAMLEERVLILVTQQQGTNWEMPGIMRPHLNKYVRAAILSPAIANFDRVAVIIKDVFVASWTGGGLPQPGDEAADAALMNTVSTLASQAKSSLKNHLTKYSKKTLESSPQDYYCFQDAGSNKKRKTRSDSAIDTSAAPFKDIVFVTRAWLKASDAFPIGLGTFYRMAMIRFIIDNVEITNAKNFWPEVEKTMAYIYQSGSAEDYIKALRGYFNKDEEVYGKVDAASNAVGPATAKNVSTTDEAILEMQTSVWYKNLMRALETAAGKLPKVSAEDMARSGW